MTKKIFNLLTTLLFVFIISSCASTDITENVASPEQISNKTAKTASIKKHKNSMFWEITGKDKNGLPSTIYVLGTIHVGDNRLYPVPDFIESAYTNADRIVGELSTDAWEVITLATNKLKNDSEKREAERIKNTGKTLSDYLTEDEKNYLLKYVKSEDVINKYEPWFLLSELSEVPITLSGLDSTKSYDIYFIEKSINNERYIEGLDTVQNQLDILSYGDWNTQLLMLKDNINDLINDSNNAGNHILDIYEAYLSADEKKLSKIINSNMKDDNKEYSKDYYNTIFVEKNKNWADQFDNFLKDGGTTFVFAGCGHFVGEDSVFQFMK